MTYNLPTRDALTSGLRGLRVKIIVSVPNPLCSNPLLPAPETETNPIPLRTRPASHRTQRRQPARATLPPDPGPREGRRERPSEVPVYYPAAVLYGVYCFYGGGFGGLGFKVGGEGWGGV